MVDIGFNHSIDIIELERLSIALCADISFTSCGFCARKNCIHDLEETRTDKLNQAMKRFLISLPNPRMVIALLPFPCHLRAPPSKAFDVC